LSRREGKIALVILSTPVSVLLCMQCFQIPESPKVCRTGFLQRFLTEMPSPVKEAL
jgi:hypothetical protein